MEKLSVRVTRALNSGTPAAAVHLHVMLARGLSDDRRRHVADRIAQMPGVEDVELLPALDIVLVKAPLPGAESISLLPEVIRVDFDSEAPIDTLFDR